MVLKKKTERQPGVASPKDGPTQHRFRRYHKETEKSQREEKTEQDMKLEKLKEAFLNYHGAYNIIYTLLSESCDSHHPWFEERSEPLLDLLLRAMELEFSSRDVERFSLALAELQGVENFGDTAWFFLSALVNLSPDSDFVIHTVHFDRPIDFGNRNRKNVVIKGDAGAVAWYNKAGCIRVEGSVGAMVGNDMGSGTLIIEGDAGDKLGCGMKGGRIVVEGDAGFEVGYCMEGGEIHLNGSYRSLSNNFPGGKIYHKGRLIEER
jgi:hypothetical protein